MYIMFKGRTRTHMYTHTHARTHTDTHVKIHYYSLQKKADSWRFKFTQFNLYTINVCCQYAILSSCLLLTPNLPIIWSCNSLWEFAHNMAVERGDVWKIKKILLRNYEDETILYKGTGCFIILVDLAIIITITWSAWQYK